MNEDIIIRRESEKDYRAVMADSRFYLAEPVNHRLMLGE